MSEGIEEKVCRLSRSLGKKVNELTIYELMTLGISYHMSGKIKAMIKAGMIKCEE